MNLFDTWTILTGLASIVSLLIAIYDKFPDWKKYILSLGWFLAGFSLGRFFTGIIPERSKILIDPILVGFLLIILLLLILVLIFFNVLIKRGETGWAYIFVMVFIMIAGPMFIDRYLEYFSFVPKGDYLLLANFKEQNNDFTSAIKYLEKYKKYISDDQMKDKVNKRIESLEEKLLTH